MAKEQTNMSVYIVGGDSVERRMIGDMFHHNLINGGFQSVHILDEENKTIETTDDDLPSLYDAIDRLRPNLFNTPIVIDLVQSMFFSDPDPKHSWDLEAVMQHADAVMDAAVASVQAALAEDGPTPGSDQDAFLRRYSASQEEAEY